MYQCGGGTQLAVTKSTTGTADTQTQASWLVTDARAEVADIGIAWVAYIVDPGKNALGILQIKE